MSPKLYSAIMLVTIVGAFVAIRVWPNRPDVTRATAISIVSVASVFALIKPVISAVRNRNKNP